LVKSKIWEIKELSRKEDFVSSAKIILQKRLENLLSSTYLYFNKINEENLHQVRIALRRLRYSMELFIKCFDRKKYLGFYTIISSLQDLSGSVRDLDVLKQNLKRFSKTCKTKTEEGIIDKISDNKNQYQLNFKLEMMKFIHGKELKEFKKIINHKN
jgi:CHAD domain-containing protein